MTLRLPSFEARLVSVRYDTEDVRVFEFARTDGAPMPVSTPGAHIDVDLGGGWIRQYSLLEAGPSLVSWEIGVRREPAGRGGSAALHDRLRVGDLVQLTGPRNAFALVEDAAYSVLIGGGIGVTPLLAMAAHLARRDAPFEFHVANRSRASATLLRRVPRHAVLHHDDEQGGVLDLAAIVQRAPGDAHLYCCGPQPMIAAFLRAAAARDADHVHVEYFASPAPDAAGESFTVELRLAGKSVRVAPGQTILQAIRTAGVAATSSCEQGICGACEVRVLAGVPDHRDSVLSDAERAANVTMMICCSRSRTPVLALEL